jgi:D-beta-D-heptose 7-phosphate kinase/D-beta-D-heptose 1-phosphate adenosyltransferase
MIKILVIGEKCVDKFVYCKTNRISPEAPVPVINPINTTTNPGMAGNTVANVKALFPDVEVKGIHQTQNITKTRFVEDKSNHMFVRLDEGDDFNDTFTWDEKAYASIKESDVVIVSDYDKGFLSDSDLKAIAYRSKLSILDSKRKLTDDIIKDFTFVKLNESEDNNNKSLNKDNVIVTLGKRGAWYKEVLYHSPNPQDTIDVSGAGDTFTAAFIVKYFELKQEDKAIQFANEKASEVVSKRGVVVPS